MSDLAKFVVNHTLRSACRCGKCIDPGNPDVYLLPHTVNMYFFDVCAVENPTVEEFLQLTKEHQGDFAELDPLDGKEHSYIEVGGWIGDQGLAMQYMGLGKLLGVWNIMHPGMLPGIDKALADQMAGMGLVSIVPKPKQS